VGFFVAQVLASVVEEIVRPHLSPDAARPWWLTVIVLIPLWAGFMVTVSVARKQRGPLWPESFFTFVPKDVLYVVLGVGLQVLVGIIYRPFHSTSVSKPVHELLDINAGWRAIIIMVFVGLGSPFFEEVFFRGMLLSLLSARFERSKVSRWAVALTCGVLFAAAHGQMVQFAGLAIVGTVLARIYQRQQRIWPCVMTHAGFNLIALIVA
jgi:membrane protease YdiL (CAAX protease family)